MLIAITTDHFFIGEIEGTIALFKQGLQTLHFRKTGASEEACRHFLNNIPNQYHNRIVLHQYEQLLEVFDLKGFHFKDGAWLEADYKRNCQYSASIHNLQDLQKVESKLSYVFLSPIFDSISKTSHKAFFDLNKLKETFSKTNTKVIALGGINKDTVIDAYNTGFDGVAGIGYLWQAFEKDKSIIDLERRFESLNIEIEA